MCVDPGLLPAETDMAKHRREVCHKFLILLNSHRIKLSFRDIFFAGSS